MRMGAAQVQIRRKRSYRLPTIASLHSSRTTTETSPPGTVYASALPITMANTCNNRFHKANIHLPLDRKVKVSVVYASPLAAVSESETSDDREGAS